MLSRIFWIGVAGIALIAGIAVQDGDSIFSWSDDRDVSAKTERAIEDRVERAIEGSFDKMEVVGSDGREVDVPAETKRAMARAVGELVKAEADLALARVGEDDEKAVREASVRRVQARREVDRLKAEIKRHDPSAIVDADTVSQQVQSQIREDIRAEVREAVGN
jgi:regulator of protease activity HflC (stomatin/prohibitin superfamily)